MSSLLAALVLFQHIQHPPINLFRVTPPTIRPVVEVWL